MEIILSLTLALLSLSVPLTAASRPPYGDRTQPPSPSHPTVDKVNSTILNLSSEVEWTYAGTSLDGPKVLDVNGTTFDWWYFDARAANPDDLSSVVVTLFLASAGGFEALSNETSVLTAMLTGTFANGSAFAYYGYPSEAVVFTKGDSTDGRWGGFGSWTSSEDLQKWTVDYTDPDQGILGYMSFARTAPAHFPCGPVEEGGSEVLMPHVGWVNPVPDADVAVNFMIDGSELIFDGVGYHDKNWGDQPFFDSVGSWYWGHGRLGPYSVVWFDALDINGTEHSSSYVAKDGKILSAGCGDKSVLVRPWGGDDTYPPPETTANPYGFILVCYHRSRGIFD
jgi:hypothetical protein